MNELILFFLIISVYYYLLQVWNYYKNSFIPAFSFNILSNFAYNIYD